uniref:Uncharacterized protein n=1 Tax=Oryza punctata TaxID=4537 RepID=A0A0E0JXI1_ORYPU
MDDFPPPAPTKPDHAEPPEPNQTTPTPAKQHEFTSELLAEFRDFGYISTSCPSPPSDIDDLNPPEEDLRNLAPHPAYKEDGDNEILNEDINNFRDDQTPPREAQSSATRLKRLLLHNGHRVTALFRETRAEKRWVVGGVSRRFDRALTDVGRVVTMTRVNLAKLRERQRPVEMIA